MVDTSGIIYAISRNNNQFTPFEYSDKYNTFGVWYRSNLNPEKIVVVVLTKGQNLVIDRDRLCDIFKEYIMLTYIGHNQTFRSLLFNTMCIIDDPNKYFQMLIELLATIKMGNVDKRTYGEILQLVHIAFYNDNGITTTANNDKSERLVDINNKLEELKKRYNIRRLNISPIEAIKRLESYLFKISEVKSC
jgi:hypothetical protein